MNDRLLDDKKLDEIVFGSSIVSDDIATLIAKAQDAKTARWIIEEVEGMPFFDSWDKRQPEWQTMKRKLGIE